MAKEGGGAEEHEQASRIAENTKSANPETRRLKSRKLDSLRCSIRKK
jgi:hypothetical protein